MWGTAFYLPFQPMLRHKHGKDTTLPESPLEKLLSAGRHIEISSVSVTT